MLLIIPEILDQDQVALCRERLDQADWQDGRITAGPQSAQVKANEQLPDTDPAARALGDLVLRALERSTQFMSAALRAMSFPRCSTDMGPACPSALTSTMLCGSAGHRA